MSFESLPEDHTPDGVAVFLDTSIPVSNHKGPLFQERIKHVLGLFKWVGSSTYVKMEYGNVVLSQAQYFLKTIKKLGSFDRAWDWVANVLPPVHDQKRIWMMVLLRNIGGEDDSERTERAIASLTRLMKFGLRYVDAMCDRPIADGTECYWARKGVTRKTDGTLEWKTPVCKTNRRRCRIEKHFFRSKRQSTVFRKVRNRTNSLRSRTS